MLTQDTKRKIDSARDILVGKVPDPKAQVEQITTALIYKFMDDMDKESQDLGGKARFFAGEYEKYAWHKLMDPRLGGQERLNLYVEAITKFSQNPHLPQLFRDIFKDAFLPFRDPQTLNLFLKEINGFTYDHSEDLGDAFEYLLSILGSQGDAGQFRTPRHIIDFIVAVVDPKKDETVCDPACGTAGFLISSYKHILKNNQEPPLTPDERKALMDHFVGYDISPDMVRLSKVNMYLHGFPNPTIFEYDTLTNEEKWEDMFDVMLANPPFMTPKGGIRPHKRFGVQANRAEVLFVDYILEHLKPQGRAGIIVPEGIIFQSANAYKTLRKKLVEDGLFAVVSLPSGVFQPYSGVKTSILFFDNTLAKKTTDMLFVKVQNDGYDLGAQRRPIDKNDLPLSQEILRAYKQAIAEGKPFTPTEEQKSLAHLVPKSKIAETGDYNLTGDRYKEVEHFTHQKWPMVELGEVCEIQRGGSPRPIQNYITKDKDGINWIKIGDVAEGEKFITKTKEKIKKEGISKTRLVKSGDFILSNSMSFGRPYIVKIDGAIHDGWLLLRINNKEKMNSDYLYQILGSNLVKEQYSRLATGGVVQNLNIDLVRSVKIPLPPLDVQQQIVDTIETKQRAIDAAKAVIAALDQDRKSFGDKVAKLEGVKWVELGELCEILDSKRKPVSKAERKQGKYPYYGATGIVDYVDEYIFDEKLVLIGEDGAKWGKGEKTAFIAEGKYWVNNHAHVLRPDRNKILDEILVVYINSIDLTPYITGITVPKLNQEKMRSIKLPLPPLEVQQKLVAEMEEKERIAEANKKLIAIMEREIQEVIESI